MPQLIRVNATFVCVCRLRHNEDLECLIDEVPSTVGRKELLDNLQFSDKRAI